jgi:hypothetical protein
LKHFLEYLQLSSDIDADTCSDNQRQSTVLPPYREVQDRLHRECMGAEEALPDGRWILLQRERAYGLRLKLHTSDLEHGCVIVISCRTTSKQTGGWSTVMDRGWRLCG